MSKERLKFLLCEMYGSTAKLLIGQGVPTTEIEDLMQEIFIDAYNNLDKLKDEEKLQAWLRVIAKNKARKFLKKNGAGYRREILLENVGEEIDKKADVDFDEVLETLIRVEGSQEITKAVNKLKDNYALIVKLHYGMGYSLKEIAYKLGLNYNTVKTINARAMKRLRDIIEQEGGQEHDKR